MAKSGMNNMYMAKAEGGKKNKMGMRMEGKPPKGFDTKDVKKADKKPSKKAAW
jgi:hypothetical protein